MVSTLTRKNLSFSTTCLKLSLSLFLVMTRLRNMGSGGQRYVIITKTWLMPGLMLAILCASFFLILTKALGDRCWNQVIDKFICVSFFQNFRPLTFCPQGGSCCWMRKEKSFISNLLFWLLFFRSMSCSRGNVAGERGSWAVERGRRDS